MTKQQQKNFFKYVIPGAVTSMNMLLGFLAIGYATQGRLVIAGWLIILAACMDGLDGRIARILSATSRFGMEYDSLSDVISFGIAPAVLVTRVTPAFSLPVFIIAFLYLVAGACRLARYNVQSTGKKKKPTFTGMPIPGAAVTVASFVIFAETHGGAARYGHVALLIALAVALLMVSTVEYDTFPKLTLRTLKSQMMTGAFVVCLVLLAKFPDTFMFIFFTGYIFFGLGRWALKRNRQPGEEDEEDPVSQEE